MKKKNKFFIYNYFYIKFEFYLNIIILNYNTIIKDFNYNIKFYKISLINKFLNLSLNNNIYKCLYLYKLDKSLNYLKSNNIKIIQTFYLKKNIKINYNLNRFFCNKFFYNFFVKIFLYFYKFLNFLKNYE